MENNIQISNLTKRPLPEKLIKKIAQKILEKEGKKNSPLSITFVGPSRMRKLNKKYRGKNRVTDVLAFPSGKLDIQKPYLQEILKMEGLGELVICPRVALKQAKRLKVEFEKELILYLIHGILHLLGYDHEKNEKEAKIMREKEEKYLKLFYQ